VVHQLSTPLILGIDWLLDHGVNIDYNLKTVSLTSVKNKIPFKLSADRDPNSLVNSLKNISISEISPSMYEPLLDLEYQSLPIKTEKNIALNDTPLITSQQNLMTTFLQNYQHIFQDKTGLHKFLTYKFNVKSHEPYKIKPYPVPFSRRPAVQKECSSGRILLITIHSLLL